MPHRQQDGVDLVHDQAYPQRHAKRADATVSLLLLLALLRGFFNAIEYPTRQSFLPEMLGSKRDLPNAIALNSSMFQVSRLIGPTIAGFIIVARGPGLCFLSSMRRAASRSWRACWR